MNNNDRNNWTIVLVALLVTAVWGFNFVVVIVGLKGVPPLLLACLRFILASIPAVFFVPFPKTSRKLVMAYGLVLGVGEFGFLFSAMNAGAPAGLASIVLQVQAFFTAILAALVAGERLRVHHALGMLVAFVGLALIGSTRGAAGIPLTAFVLVLLAALMWAVANIITRKAARIDALGLMVWSSLAPPLPLFALSLWLEGPQTIAASLRNLSAVSVGAIVYLALISTLLGYGLWNWLITRRGAAAIAPFSLLVPIFASASAALFLHEAFTTLHAVAGGLILSGLFIHVFGGQVLTSVWRTAKVE